MDAFGIYVGDQLFWSLVLSVVAIIAVTMMYDGHHAHGDLRAADRTVGAGFVVYLLVIMLGTAVSVSWIVYGMLALAILVVLIGTYQATI